MSKLKENASCTFEAELRYTLRAYPKPNSIFVSVVFQSYFHDHRLDY